VGNCFLHVLYLCSFEGSPLLYFLQTPTFPSGSYWEKSNSLPCTCPDLVMIFRWRLQNLRSNSSLCHWKVWLIIFQTTSFSNIHTWWSAWESHLFLAQYNLHDSTNAYWYIEPMLNHHSESDGLLRNTLYSTNRQIFVPKLIKCDHLLRFPVNAGCVLLVIIFICFCLWGNFYWKLWQNRLTQCDQVVIPPPADCNFLNNQNIFLNRLYGSS
jgi:hypothetical protein